MASAPTRLLVVVGAAADDVDAVPPLVRALLQRADEVLVVAPALPGPLQWIASDVDRALWEADERLATVAGQIEQIAGGPVEAAVGDETPMTAFDDAVGRFRPDHILIARRAGDHSSWQEAGLVDQVLNRFHIPVTVFDLDATGRVPG